MEYPSLPIINVAHEFGKGLSPFLAKLVILPITGNGSVTEFNRGILEKLGYTSLIIPTAQQLTDGYHYYKRSENDIHVLFVVTLDPSDSSANLLVNNLTSALIEVSMGSRNQTIWIPPMEIEHLDFEVALGAIADVINNVSARYFLDAYFYISLPDEVDDSWLQQEIRRVRPKSPRSRILSAEDFVDHLKSAAYFLSPERLEDGELTGTPVKYTWHKDDKEDFLTELMEGVNAGDIIFFNTSRRPYRSIAQKWDEYVLDIIAIGVVVALTDGQRMRIDWGISDIHIITRTEQPYTKTLQSAGREDVINVLKGCTLADLISMAEVVNVLYVAAAPAKVSISKISHFHSDIETTTDHLDITSDVAAFARIIAASSFEPPWPLRCWVNGDQGRAFLWSS